MKFKGFFVEWGELKYLFILLMFVNAWFYFRVFYISECYYISECNRVIIITGFLDC